MTEIARIEHTSVMTVSKSIHKGLKKIEEILKKGGLKNTVFSGGI